MSALKLGLEKLHRRQSCANISSEGVSTATNKTELDDETSTRNNDLGNEGTNPSGTGREDGPSERSSLSPPPFPPSPRRLSPSPTSSAEFRGYLDHLPEMNLPWQPLRSVTRCACGRAFTFLVSKVSKEMTNPPSLKIIKFPPPSRPPVPLLSLWHSLL